MELHLPIVFNDRYQLFKKIGEGGLAEVYQAQDMSLERMVAVKVLRPQYTRDHGFLVNFHREAQSAARLSNPSIVAVYDFGQYQSRPYIVMEWIPGSDLRTVIHERGVIPVDLAIEYAVQVCSAVGTAHRAGLVHGDLKPANILITHNGQAKVADFGLARALGESAMDEGEVVWGTPAYFAPEQASGGRVLPATDVYAVGIILYEMLTGRVPFVGVDDQEVARKQIYEAHIPIDRINPRLPEPLARIVDAAMAKNPNERFLTADHLREALLMYKQGALMPTGFETPISAVVGSPVQASPGGGRQRGRPAPRPRGASSPIRLDYLLLFLGLVAIIAVLGLVPLLVALYNAYQPSLGGSAAPAPDLPPGQVRVPDIVGLEEAAARSALQNMGLELVVDGEEPHTTLPAFAIVKQSVQPGAAVGEGSAVHVTLSQGPPMIEIPELVGLRYEEAEQQLQALDLAVQKYEDWSAETPGNVINQDPPAGSLVENRTLITLFVSNGSRTPVGANLGGQILLTAYDIPRLQYRPGEAVSLTFFWQAITPLTENYNLFIYLTTLQGGIVSEIDTPPLGAPLTSNWQVGQIVADPYQLTIPPTTVSGDYQIRIGFYNSATNTRLPITEPGRAEQDNLGALILRTIQVLP